MSSAPTQLRWSVAGHVQGVFFRASTAERARALGLAGWARNLPDGRVEVVASGTPAALGALTEWLWSGPRLARVDSVTVETWSGDPGPDFRVR
jgi:acylphosphatase